VCVCVCVCGVCVCDIMRVECVCVVTTPCSNEYVVQLGRLQGAKDTVSGELPMDAIT
jgi:hypothetical protein